jgi:D-alanyl-D-alanine carboxypeptidase/D-alanyl-D-alanine-endopeptidase (penicillin-binding protein 4)
VSGAPLVEVVQHVLEVSDNEGAEVLARQVALAVGRPASFTGGADAVREVLRGLGVPLDGAELHDGSGLSRQDRLPVRTLLRVLALAADPDHPELSGVLEGLPVAGFSGSLAGRFLVGADPGLGFVRAKTGTLTGVSGLAGVTVGPDHAPLLFVVVADRFREPNTLFTRARLDQVAAALAACRCAAH